MKLILRLICLAALALLIGCGSGADAAPRTVELTITDPPGEAVRIEVPLRSEVTILITTPTDDRAHLHGYEVELDTPAGETVELRFTADMVGSYELESHVTNAIWANVVVR